MVKVVSLVVPVQLDPGRVDRGDLALDALLYKSALLRLNLPKTIYDKSVTMKSLQKHL
jgi:hypothetical protein